MAGQKPAGRGRTGGTTGSGRTGGRQGSASRANQGRPTQGATTKTGGNGAASARSRPGAKQATTATPRGATAVTKGSPNGVAPPAAARPLGRLGGLLSSIGFVPLATFLLSLYGLGASIYLTIAHYDTSVTLVCSDKGLVNCAEVTTSPQSMVFGIFPVAVLGLAYYVFMTALNSPWVWRRQDAWSDKSSNGVGWLHAGMSYVRSNISYIRLGAVVAGIGFVLYLIYAELIQIGAICLWCTSVHVATFLIFTLVVFSTSFSSRTPATAHRG